jgi:hypothetical protein
VALKKPSELFSKENILDQVQEKILYSEFKEVENTSDAFHSFKNNLNHIQTLSDFSSTFEGFKENFEKVNVLCEEIDHLKKDLKTSLKKEDLDGAMMSHLLFVEECIEEIQNNIKSLNSKTLYNIKEEFQQLQEYVVNFINIDAPVYKKRILDHEIKIDEKFTSFKENIYESIYEINEKVENEVSFIAKNVSNINKSYLNNFKNEISLIENKINFLLKEELPKYKKFFIDIEFKTEEKLKNFNNIVDDKINNIDSSYQTQLKDLNILVNKVTEDEIPKYRGFVEKSKIKLEQDFINLESSIQNKIKEIDKSIKSIIEETESKTKNFDDKISDNLSDFRQVVENTKHEIKTISETYQNLYKDFRKREIHENEKLQSYQEVLNSFSEKISTIENHFTKEIYNIKGDIDLNYKNLEESFFENITDVQNNLNANILNFEEKIDNKNLDYYNALKEDVETFEYNISNKIKDLEVNITINEKHIHKIKDSVYEVLDNLKLDLIEKKSKELSDKILYVENILDKFNEKTLLSEGLLNEPPETKTKDPLTPLDKTYVTIQDLQNHYKIFINRIQQQLSTLGGGGEVRLEFLDDIDRSSAKIDNYYLKYNASIDKWVGDPADGVGITSIISITGFTTYYQSTDTDDYIGVSGNVPVTIVLPLYPSLGKRIIVKDEGINVGNISTISITIAAGVGKSIDNEDSINMTSNAYQSYTFFNTGYNWFIV